MRSTNFGLPLGWGILGICERENYTDFSRPTPHAARAAIWTSKDVFVFSGATESP